MNAFNITNQMLGQHSVFNLFFIIIFIWSLFWKGLALWHSARRESKIWFIILLIINTVGILEIIYLFIILKIKPSKLFHK